MLQTIRSRLRTEEMPGLRLNPFFTTLGLDEYVQDCLGKCS